MSQEVGRFAVIRSNDGGRTWGPDVPKGLTAADARTGTQEECGRWLEMFERSVPLDLSIQDFRREGDTLSYTRTKPKRERIVRKIVPADALKMFTA